MSAPISSTASKVVIVGSGVSARQLVKALSSARNVQITVVQPNDFTELPFSGPLTLAYPKYHSNFVSGQGIVGVKTVLGTAISATDGTLTVKLFRGGAEEQIPFDFLVAATGFKFAKLAVTPGQSFEERQQEIAEFNKALTTGGDVVIGGGGVIAIELAGNMAEVVNQKKASDSSYQGKVKIVTSGASLLADYPAKYQTLATNQLKSVGVEVITSDRVESHPDVTVGSKFSCTLKSGKTLENVGVYLPGFIGKANTEYLEGFAGALNPNSKAVLLDEHLRSKAYPKLFALGGCAEFAKKESYLGVPKMEQQAKTIAANIVATLKDTKLVVHSEGEPTMTKAPAVFMGHHTSASFVPEVMPCLPAFICKACGPPCNLLCPCFCCGVCAGKCGVGCCGPFCCADPQGPGVSAALLKFSLSGIGAGAMGFNGTGAAIPPQNERIVRS